MYLLLDAMQKLFNSAYDVIKPTKQSLVYSLCWKPTLRSSRQSSGQSNQEFVISDAMRLSLSAKRKNFLATLIGGGDA
jgi:hypothetical protein